MRRILRDLPGPDQEAQTKVVQRQTELTKPPGSLGRLEEIAEWLAAWQGRASPRVERPRIAVFAGTHGVAARGVSAYPSEVTGQMVKNFLSGGAAINQLAGSIDADLRIYELDLDHPTDDFTKGPAMSEARAANAMAYGMMAAEPGIDVLCLGEMGIANTTTAATLCAALFGGTGADWAGPGTGVQGKALGAQDRRHRRGAGAPSRAHRRSAIRWPCWRPSAARSSRPSPAPCWPPAWAASRCFWTAMPARRRPRCCTRSTATRSTIAWWRIARPSPATRGSWRRSASDRCSTSACAWARPRRRRWRCRS